MGLVKNWMMEEAAKERNQQVREWLEAKRGRKVSQREIDAAWDDFELDEAFQHALDKDD